ncbi:UDP-3-O-acyl-N-acetylglucosamine deacetylase [Asaia spathodeae]|uniref:UDP-3-O-acyl-N-acetylglucosamine deacetylase n=1 Tax=Asaia spathodeae TaxID=657016 RepID=A0ABX2P6I8_9PROT|nr:UDP-3-O-acyl-N-acetylglucosamine deacetylase [Asaia spathodeae]GBR11684.1 UDP-3-O-[3-hydroxymyristoyl] N-acetylglucosamine deacetylase [Asaia spathodeae NBRC 105894]
MQITAETPFKASIVPLPLSNIAQGFSSITSSAARVARQATLNQAITCVGIGLHSGARVRMVLNPAPVDHGIVFKRSDLPESRLIPARHDHVVCTRLSTVIAHPDAPDIRIATIEHLMAALHANGIDNALIEIDGPETPVLDGSAAEFDFLIQCAGTVMQEPARSFIEVLRPVRVEEASGAYAELRPARSGMALAMSIDFAASVIGQQRHAMPLTLERFRQEVGFCRTFVERKEIEALQKMGLARGGSLHNAIVVEDDTVLNPCGLRHPKEFVRHKLMDAVGDLYLAGHTLQAGFMGHKSGHGLNNRLLHALFASPENWRLVDGERAEQPVLRATA